jgi:hypothetical protein
VRLAQGEETAEERTIMLNVALAWLRLARQREEALSPPLSPHDDEAALSEHSDS